MRRLKFGVPFPSTRNQSLMSLISIRGPNFWNLLRFRCKCNRDFKRAIEPFILWDIQCPTAQIIYVTQFDECTVHSFNIRYIMSGGIQGAVWAELIVASGMSHFTRVGITEWNSKSNDSLAHCQTLCNDVNIENRCNNPKILSLSFVSRAEGIAMIVYQSIHLFIPNLNFFCITRMYFLDKVERWHRKRCIKGIDFLWNPQRCSTNKLAIDLLRSIPRNLTF